MKDHPCPHHPETAIHPAPDSLATDEPTFWKHFQAQKPGLLLVDLEGDEAIWSRVLGEIQSITDGIQVVAFGPHENVAALEKARGYGCDLVLNKGEFNRDLPKILAELS